MTRKMEGVVHNFLFSWFKKFFKVPSKLMKVTSENALNIEFFIKQINIFFLWKWAQNWEPLNLHRVRARARTMLKISWLSWALSSSATNFTERTKALLIIYEWHSSNKPKCGAIVLPAQLKQCNINSFSCYFSEILMLLDGAMSIFFYIFLPNVQCF